MLDELVKQVSQRVGIPEEQAKQAVETVLGFLKERLPAPLASQIDGLLSGNASAGDITSAIGGLFGRR
jgi:hypothetical protein